MWIGITISTILIFLFLFTVDVHRMLGALSSVNYVYIAPAVGMYLVSTYFRAFRWKVLLSGIKPISTRRLFPVVVVGYMANNLLPMRLGEFVRAYYIGEREGISKASALVTVFVERVFDALSLLFFITVIAMFTPLTDLGNVLDKQFGIPWPIIAGVISVSFIGTLAMLVLFAIYPSMAKKLTFILTRPFPNFIQTTAFNMIVDSLDGLKSLEKADVLGLIFLLSIPIWISEATVFLIIGLPFGFHNLHSSFEAMIVNMILVTSVTNIGSSIPAAPGGIGLFEIIARETLVMGPFAEIDRATAAGFAVVVHATLLLPMIILGQVILWAGHMSLKRLSQKQPWDEAKIS